MKELRMKALAAMGKSAPAIDMSKPRGEELMGDKGMISMLVSPEEKEMILKLRQASGDDSEETTEEAAPSEDGF